MSLLRPVLCASLLVVSNFASAAFTVTSNGFFDSATSLEWLAPSRITSLSDYNAYASNGWRVASGIELDTILTNSYEPFDASFFNVFATFSSASQGSLCTQYQAVYCAFGWYHNVGSNGESYGYESIGIGLLSSPAQTNPILVSQQNLNIGTFTISPSTIGSYPLYGYGNSYDTFMVKAVPLPSAVWIFLSAIGTLSMRKLKRRVV